jgi:hypothetical protein
MLQYTMAWMLSFFVFPMVPGEVVQPTQHLPRGGKSTYFCAETVWTEEIEQLGKA